MPIIMKDALCVYVMHYRMSFFECILNSDSRAYRELIEESSSSEARVMDTSFVAFVIQIIVHKRINKSLPK